MKIVRSSKCTTKWLTAEKRSALRRVLEEYGRVVNIFIDHFWDYHRRESICIVSKERCRFL